MLSICIPVLPYDKKIVDITQECLYRIMQHTVSEHEIIVVINGGSVDYHPEIADVAKYYKKAIGNPSGWNRGLDDAKGDIICFMDNDVWVTEGWDRPLIERLQDRNVGIALPYVHRKEGDGFVPVDDNFQGCCIVTRRDVINLMQHPTNKDIVPGYGFDERFDPAYCEDTDFYLRARLLGFDRQTVKESVVQHHSGSTCTPVFGDIERVAIASRQKYEEKWKHLGKDPGGQYRCWTLWH